MLLTSEQLLYENRGYAVPQARIQRMVMRGELISLKRGMFETDASVSGIILANEILGPSYISFEYALSYYGMIPERVQVYTSASFGLNKKKEFANKFGLFTYRDIPRKAFPFYYNREWWKNRPYLIASREKALCDQLSITNPIRGIKDFREYLFDGLRLDEELFGDLDGEKIRLLGPLYHRTNLDQLVRLVEQEDN
jgi:hypothetical protein